MQRHIEERLRALREEFRQGQLARQRLDEQLAGLAASMHRISGAIQALDELQRLARETPAAEAAAT